VTLLWLEIVKLRFQKRSWIGYIALAVIPVIGAVALSLSRGKGGGPENLPFLSGVFRNGVALPVFSLVALGPFLLPLAASMVGAFMVAGEAEAGTLKTILARPVRRGALLAAKWAVGMLYLLAGLLLVLAVALVAGRIAFGYRPMFTPQVTFSVGTTVWLTFLAYLMSLVAVSAVLSLAILLSTLTSSSLTASIASLVLVIVVEVLLQFSSFAFLRPYLFTTYFLSWADLFSRPLEWAALVKALLVPGAWAAGFSLLAWLRFRSRDILV
jgi:ABC-2 type transport system permease protein